MAASSAGYSGTPLARKLGFKPSMHAVVVDPPAHYRSLLEPLPDGVVFEPKAGKSTALVHVFVTERTVLDSHLRALRRSLNPEAMVWISWPKKTSKVPTTVTEDVVRELALPLGWVDVKVCAVDEVWSGLKLVVRRELRECSQGKGKG